MAIIASSATPQANKLKRQCCNAHWGNRCYYLSCFELRKSELIRVRCLGNHLNIRVRCNFVPRAMHSPSISASSAKMRKNTGAFRKRLQLVLHRPFPRTDGHTCAILRHVEACAGCLINKANPTCVDLQYANTSSAPNTFAPDHSSGLSITSSIRHMPGQPRCHQALDKSFRAAHNSVSKVFMGPSITYAFPVFLR